jgi:hypothetical protein
VKPTGPPFRPPRFPRFRMLFMKRLKVWL